MYHMVEVTTLHSAPNQPLKHPHQTQPSPAKHSALRNRAGYSESPLSAVAFMTSSQRGLREESSINIKKHLAQLCTPQPWPGPTHPCSLAAA